MNSRVVPTAGCNPVAFGGEVRFLPCPTILRRNMRIIHWRRAFYAMVQDYPSRELVVPDDVELVSKMVEESEYCQTAKGSDKTICYGWTNLDTGEEHIVWENKRNRMR